ncbi:MAG: WYL domain-containing protein, partial [Clostridiales bacterium]
FLDENLIKKLVYELKDIDNSIKNEYIEFTNVIKKHKDFDKENYKNNFKKILKAILYNKIIVYDNIDKFDNSYHGIEVLPVNIEYSLRDNIFRVSIYLISDKKIVMVDIYSMDNIKILDKKPEITREYVLEQQYMQKYSKDPIVLEVFDKRQAMERCFMCFSGLERTAKIISENKYELTLKYYLFNEEKIIRSILSLGPYVKVISPMRIKNNIIERLKKSFDLFGNN